MVLYCIGFFARYRTVMYRCYSAPANYRVVHLVILYRMISVTIKMLLTVLINDRTSSHQSNSLSWQGSLQ